MNEPHRSRNDDEALLRRIEILSIWTSCLQSELGRMRELNVRLRRQLSIGNAGFPDDGESHHPHLSLRFADLLQKSGLRLIAASLTKNGVTPGSEQVAVELSKMTRILLSSAASPADLCAHLDLDFETHGPELADLLGRIASLADRLPSARWDFQATIGARLDALSQEPWESCDPGAPVKFVVTPSWRSSRRVHIKQTVFTG